MLMITKIYNNTNNVNTGDSMEFLNEPNKFNICVLTLPFQNVLGATPTILSNFIDVLEPLSNELFVITGKFPDRTNKRIHIIRIKADEKRESMLIRIPKFIMTQIRISYNLIKIRKNIDIVIFFLGGRAYLLPMSLLKLLKKKTVVIAVGSIMELTKIQYADRVFGMGGYIFSHIMEILGKLNYTFSDKIVVYSENVINQFGLDKYRDKICVAHRHFLDFNKFEIKKKINERDNLVGYIGRFSMEKGILYFVQAIPEISEGRSEIKFLIGGDGYLQDKIEKYLDEENLNDEVELTGWIPHDELPDYLNELKLLVLPSYTEGLPNIMLESMACGTAVLATPVGAIPNVIKDGETGFILENNSPECIAENIVRVLNYRNLDIIINNARKLVEKEFTYEAAVEKYREILKSILGVKK